VQGEADGGVGRGPGGPPHQLDLLVQKSGLCASHPTNATVPSWPSPCVSADQAAVARADWVSHGEPYSGVVRGEVHRRIVANQPQTYAIQPPDSPEDILVDRRICE
jgi:hypothetical protein